MMYIFYLIFLYYEILNVIIHTLSSIIIRMPVIIVMFFMSNSIKLYIIFRFLIRKLL